MAKNVNQKDELDNIDENVKQVLLGSLLGDSSLRKNSKNASLSCTHSPKQKKYLLWKRDIINKNFKVNVKLYNNQSNGHKFKSLRLTTNCSPILTNIHSWIYVSSKEPGKIWDKIIDSTFLERLNPLGIAVWYCDDGTYYVRDRSCSLATQGFSYKDNLIIKDYFYNKWDIKSVIIKDYNREYNKNYYRVTFNRVEAFKFLELVKDFIPESMQYKLGHLSEINKELMEIEDRRYREISKKWYYDNHEKALGRARRYRESNRDLINKKRVQNYWNNIDKSRQNGKESMRKRRLANTEKGQSQEKCVWSIRGGGWAGALKTLIKIPWRG